jgi:hypothetical protein
MFSSVALIAPSLQAADASGQCDGTGRSFGTAAATGRQGVKGSAHQDENSASTRLGSAGGPASAGTPIGLVVLLTPSLLLGSAFLVLVLSPEQRREIGGELAARRRG